MKSLSKSDQAVLRLLSEGKRDHEICIELRLSQKALDGAVARIQGRATHESEDAAWFYERALRRRAENSLASLHARFDALMEVLMHAVLVVDGRTGKIKEVNEVACSLFGYSRREFIGLSVEELVPDSHRPRHVAYRLGFLSSVRRREMGYHPPIQGLRADGTLVEMAIALTATPIDDDVMVVCTEYQRWKGGKETVERASTGL
ncbi:MAG TPA: PAS domain S-box protein [Fimbriimonas sp.]|nr:PAS domain S-box protein [Fimbriimonas sp.]